MIEIWTESTKLNTTSQRIADQAGMILKKGSFFFNLKIQEICGQVNCWKYNQEPSSGIETLNNVKQEFPKWTEMQNTVNRNTTHASITK